MQLLPYRKNMMGAENHRVDLYIADNNVPYLTVSGVTKNQDGSLKETIIGGVAIDYTGACTIHNSDNPYDITSVAGLEEWGKIVDTRIGIHYDWVQLIQEAMSLHAKYNAYMEQAKLVIAEALALGSNKEYLKSISNIKFNRNNKIFASAINSKLAVFIYKPENRVYVFETEGRLAIMKIGLHMDLIKLHSEQTWCTCEDKSNTEHVDNYADGHSGWVCRKCGRFVHID